MTRRVLLLVTCGVMITGCAMQTRKDRPDMTGDETSIRAWYDQWIRATTVGDLELARGLIADDAVFLMPGLEPMDKESFAAAATATDPNIDFDLKTEIREIRVFGDHAMLWSAFSLGMTDKASGQRTDLAGHELSVLRRAGDGWVVIRDANTMAPTAED